MRWADDPTDDADPDPGATALYDAAAAAPAPRAAATVPLRRAHNELKARVLAAHAGAARVLDLACGRGGDLRKWAAAGFGGVLGLDASAASVAEARRRAAQAGLGGLADFRVCRTVTARDDDAYGTFDLVSCMFALHYFFGSPEDAEACLRFVRRHLRLGGRFAGVAPDGDRTRALLASRGGGPVARRGAYALEAAGPLAPEPAWADRYRFALEGTVVSAGSEEPFLLEARLREVAARCNLAVRSYAPLPPLPDFPEVFVATFECVAV